MILGERTAGDGYWRVPIDLPVGARLELTTAEYLLPDARPLEGRGVDVDVELSGANARAPYPSADPVRQFAHRMLKGFGDADAAATLRAAEPTMRRDAGVKAWSPR